MDIQYKSNNFLHEQKLKLLNPDSKPNEDNNIKYELIDDLSKSEILDDLNVYLPLFMETLWKQPNIVSKILLNANNKDMSEHLSYFFCHNFYENILSPNYIEYNLLYLITLMLKDEINNMPKKSLSDPIKSLDIFLNNTPSGILLEQFQKKNDVQTFFETILLNIVENLERNSSNREIIFDLNKIELKCKGRHGIPDSRSQSRNIDINMHNVINENYLTVSDFFFKYAINMNKEYFNDKIQKCKENRELNIMEYFLYHFNSTEAKKNPVIYNSEIFNKRNTTEILGQQVLDEYITNFDKTINLITDLLKNLLDNLYLLPYSIKCICKIIFALVSKRFKLFNHFQKLAFISKFFFEKLFIPIFQNPALGALINSFIISSQTLKNLEEISKIIIIFSSGDFFKTNNKETESYTPFNAYFVQKIKELFNFYEEIIKIELPSFIDKLINDELEENYEYDFFKENQEEVVYHFSTCFNMEELSIILDLLDKNKKKIFDVAKGNEDKYKDLITLKIVFEKLISKKSKETFKKIKNNPEYEIVKIPIYHKKKKEIKEYKETKGRKIIKYFLISNIILNQNYSKLINFTQEKKFFNLKEINAEETDENNNNKENIQNKIIKIKNFLCTILYNYRALVKTDFEEDKISNTISILKELKKLMRCSNNMLIVNFPSQWYVDSLLDYLSKIPDKYKADDFEFLITDLQKEVNNSIKSMNFEDLSILIDKMKFATRGKNYYENVINLVLDMKMNKTAQNIVEKENLEIEILFKINDKKKEFKIYKPSQSQINLQYFDNVLAAPIDKGTRVCKSINSFTRHFPHMKKYSEKLKYQNLFEFLKVMDVPKQIKEFFKIIKDCLINIYNITDEKEILNIFEKINDYVMEKLFEKIYPPYSSPEDEKIFEICEKLKDNEPGFFIKIKNSQSFESFLPELTHYLLQIEKEKSVRKKLFNLKKIFESMNNLSKFNGGKSYDLDTQVQILTYVLVKAQPKNIYTDCQYMELFIGDKKDTIEGQNLIELRLVCEHLLGTNSNKNNGI